MKKFVIWTAIIMVISLGAGIAIMAATADFNFESHQILEEKQISTEGTSEIAVNSISDDIQILRTDSPEIKAELKTYRKKDDQKERLSIEKNEVTKKVDIRIPKDKKLTFLEFNWGSKLTIYLPKTYKGNLEIKSVSADLIANDLSGIQTVKINSTSGDIKMFNMTGIVDAESVSGDVDISNSVLAANIKLKTTSGDVKLDLPESISCKFNFHTTSGDLTNNTEIIIGSNHRNYEGKAGDEKYNIVIDTVSGDLELN